MEIRFRPTSKQHQLFEYLKDENTTEILYGGSVASGKSYAIAAILVMYCLKYPGIRIGLAREHLTVLKKTTLTSVFECMSDWGLTKNHYKYNGQTGEITFYNGSAIILVELAYNPSDPKYTRLGGLLLTFGVGDEFGEVDEKGKEIYQTRLGRWKNEEFGIKPILIMTANPARNFLYRDFYLPNRDNNLPSYRKFIQALPEDNTYLPPGYIENLTKTLTMSERRRLLRGEWEVQDEVDALFTQSDMDNMFDLTVEWEGDRTHRISADIAFTSDRCVFVVWEGLRIKKVIIKEPETGTVINTLNSLATEYRVRPDNISYDADGVGLYLREHFPAAKEIHNNNKALKNEGYKNLKTELFFRLSDLVKDGEVKFIDQSYRNIIEEELSCIRHKPRETMTTAIELISKTDMKKVLGRSPDIADALAYGMIFHLKKMVMDEDDIVFLDW